MASPDGGFIIGEALARNQVRHLFTLCGGHISPILVGAKAHGARVVDVRDEASAVFAADAVARMTGGIGAAAVTAGPGVTNTITAVKNAQMAQSPVLILGGATATVLRGRGSLQDIDQLSLMAPTTKWATRVSTRAALGPVVQRACDIARGGVPGPVFVEVPVDLLYPEALVRQWYMKESGVEGASGLPARALELYLKGRLLRQFHQPHVDLRLPRVEELPLPKRPGQEERIARVADLLRGASRPVLVVGSQTLAGCREPERLAAAVTRLGVPVFLGGAARGLLGRQSDIQLRHKRGRALKEADLVIVAGFPFDFRLGYGRSIPRGATLVAANLGARELRKNRRPDVALQMHPARFIEALAAAAGEGSSRWGSWLARLHEREQARDAEIAAQAEQPLEGGVNPLRFFRELEAFMADDAVLVVDGGDFVATAAYILRPRGPLRWLDPGVFGTLGVGGGFAVGAALCHPGAEVWLIYGDGSSAYSLAELDTCVRHGLAPIAVVGNDGCWAQIAREQVEVLGDDVGTTLLRNDYHVVGEGYGALGLRCTEEAAIGETLARAREAARSGRPVVINLHIGRTDFRKGSISM